VFDAEGMRHLLRYSKSLAKTKADVEQLTKVLTGLRGVKLTLRVDQAIHGELQLDFDSPPNALTPVGKALVLEAMDAIGLSIDEMTRWSARVRGNSFVLAGELTQVSARNLLKQFSLQTAAPEPPPDAATGQPSQDPKATTALRYYRSLKSILDDVKSQKTKTFKQLAQFYRQGAEQIEQLPILNVDPDLIKFGTDLSVTLRGLGNLAKGTGAREKYLQGSMSEYAVTTYAGYTNGYGYGAYFPQTQKVNNFSQVNNMQALTNAQEAAIRTQTWTNIDVAMNQMRQKMVARYKIEF
jgi:hypothetical protein